MLRKHSRRSMKGGFFENLTNSLSGFGNSLSAQASSLGNKLKGSVNSMTSSSPSYTAPPTSSYTSTRGGKKRRCGNCF